jgi:hypothetical protein
MQTTVLHPRVVAYNYFANYFGWPILNTLQEVLNNPYKERRPNLMSQTYLVDGLKLISTLYEVQKEKYVIKVAGTTPTELYIFKPEDVNKGDITFVAYDLNTQKPIEYYKHNHVTETKYNFDTDELKQTNYFNTYEQLPEAIKLAVKDFIYKKYIFIYAEKPYGAIIECKYK